MTNKFNQSVLDKVARELKHPNWEEIKEQWSKLVVEDLELVAETSRLQALEIIEDAIKEISEDFENDAYNRYNYEDGFDRLSDFIKSRLGGDGE